MNNILSLVGSDEFLKILVNDHSNYKSYDSWLFFSSCVLDIQLGEKRLNVKSEQLCAFT